MNNKYKIGKLVGWVLLVCFFGGMLGIYSLIYGFWPTVGSFAIAAALTGILVYAIVLINKE